jgi:LPS-assembly protein
MKLRLACAAVGAFFTASFVLAQGPSAASPTPAAPAPAKPSPGAVPAPAAAPVDRPDRITFEFRVPRERGGGTLAGSAESIETQGEEQAELTGDIEIKYRDLTFRADHAVLHRDTMTVEAEGDVVLDQSSRRIAAVRADFDLDTETGTFFQATAYAEPDQYFTGAVVRKTGENSFEIEKGILTSCTGDPTPDWSFRVRRAKVDIGGYAHMRGTTMRAKKLPVLYLPYMIWPARTERTSGFLVPNFGYTANRGVYLGLAYYQVMGPSADLTLQLDGYVNTYAGAGAQVRYAPTEGTKGDLSYYMLANRDTQQREWRAVWDHTASKLPGGFRGVISLNQYSDYDFFRQFQRLEGENTRRFLYSNAFLSGDWGAQSLSMQIDQRETFLGEGDTSSIQRKLPEVNFQLRKLKLGGVPLYLSMNSTASYLQSTTDDLFDVSYGRFDLAPELTLPLRVAPWLNLTLNGGGRATWWGDSRSARRVDPLTGTSETICDSGVVPDGQLYCGETLTRIYPDAGFGVVGPSFSKIFDSPGGQFSKFKHIIEPRFTYAYIGSFDEQAKVPRFDQIDSFRAAQLGTVSLINRVLAKPTDETQGGAFEMLSFTLAQSFSFDNTQPLQRSSDGSRTSTAGPISALLRVSPSKNFDLQAKADWSTLFANLDSTSLSARARADRASMNLTWYTNYNVESGKSVSDQVRFGFSLDVIKDRLTFSGQVNYDLLDAAIQQQNYALNYKSQCWSLRLEGREQTTSTYTTRDFRFLLSLKNVGTFLDLHGGNRAEKF